MSAGSSAVAGGFTLILSLVAILGETAMPSESWLQFVERFGVTAGILGCVLYGLYRIGMYAAIRTLDEENGIATRFVNGHLASTEANAKAIQSIEQHSAKQVEATQAIRDTLREMQTQKSIS